MLTANEIEALTTGGTSVAVAAVVILLGWAYARWRDAE